MNNKQAIEVLEQMKDETKIALWGITRRIENIKKRNETPLDFDYEFKKEKEEYIQALDLAIAQIQVNEQIRRERDIAIDQLHELGYEFGEKIREEDKRPLVVDTKKTNKNIRLTAEDFNKALISDELKAECEKAKELLEDKE